MPSTSSAKDWIIFSTPTKSSVTFSPLLSIGFIFSLMLTPDPLEPAKSNPPISLIW